MRSRVGSLGSLGYDRSLTFFRSLHSVDPNVVPVCLSPSIGGRVGHGGEDESMLETVKAFGRWILILGLIGLVGVPAWAEDESEEDDQRFRFSFGFEGKAHYRDSDFISFRREIPLSVGTVIGFLETADPGEHVEVSTLTLFLDAEWGEKVQIHAKVDTIDRYDRNPTSEDREIDLDEIWIRFGQETDPAILPERSGAYLKIGKMPKFERQDDRHLESYGLLSTAFNRFEDSGVELGVDLGRHFYLKGSISQGNPVFMRDPNALAGDNGTPDSIIPGVAPPIGSGIVIPYDAEIEDIDFDLDGDLEHGLGLGLRFADDDGYRGVDVLLWGYRRDLQPTVELEGTIYGGDLDFLLGPLDEIPFAVSGNEKEEFGANLWLYWGGFSLFGQWADQDLAGLERDGWELEAAWSYDLPYKWGIGGRQILTYIQPAVRYSELDPDFGVPAGTPTPSFAWDWEKIDIGLRLGLFEGIDLTVEYAVNDFVVAGNTRSNDELLTTLRLRWN